MKMRFLLLVLVTLVASSCTTTVRHKADYQSSLSGGHNQSLILPPAVEVNIVDLAVKKERLYDYEYHLENIISQDLLIALEKQGLRAKILTRRNLHDQELTRDEAMMRERYVEIREKLYKKIEMNEKQAFNIDENVGPRASLIGSKNDSSLLVILDYIRISKTGGARTADFMMDAFLRTNKTDLADRVVIVVGLIEARTGNILWTNLSSNEGGIFSSAIDKSSVEDKAEAKRIQGILANIFKPLEKDNKKN
jgi:hypothetical protein